LGHITWTNEKKKMNVGIQWEQYRKSIMQYILVRWEIYDKAISMGTRKT
jgi:hypothetical protein